MTSSVSIINPITALKDDLVRDIKSSDTVLETYGRGEIITPATECKPKNVTVYVYNPHFYSLHLDKAFRSGIPINIYPFSGLEKVVNGVRYTVHISYPPIVPGGSTFTLEKEVEKNDPFGRKNLDTLIAKGGECLAPNGRMWFLTSSVQGWTETKEKLHGNGWTFEVYAQRLVPLVHPLDSYVPFWRESAPDRITVGVGEDCFYHTLYVVKAVKR